MPITLANIIFLLEFSTQIGFFDAGGKDKKIILENEINFLYFII
jgi:hypothetical protein